MKRYKLVAPVIAVLLLVSQVNIGLAYTEQVYSYYVGSSHAVATQDAYPVDINSWNANIKSFTIAYYGASPGSGQAIGTIGWT
jgi:hypothetical protein